MNKLHNIEDYILSAKAYYVFLMGVYNNNQEWKDVILDKKYLCGAKVNFISNLMFSIKEDLVDVKEGLVYESNLFLDRLEQTVDFIAEKTDCGYKIGDYVANDAGTIVAVIRNKFAHGDFFVDFDNNMVVMNSAGVELKLNVDKLASFIVFAFLSAMKYKKRNVYEHDIALFEIKDKNRKARLKTKSEIKNLIKSIRIINFKIESLDSSDIDMRCMQLLDVFMKYYSIDPDAALKSSKYEFLNQFLKSKNCVLSITSKSIKDKTLITDIYEYIKNIVIYNEDVDYIRQIRLIGAEVQRRLNDKYNAFSPMFANIKNLVLLSSISETWTTDMEVLSDYFTDKYDTEIKINYDELGVSFLSMFNALFIYPLEDVYTSVGGYKIDRSNEFDFSKLDVTMINPSILELDYLPIDISFNQYNSLLNKKSGLESKLSEHYDNLNNVISKGNMVAKNKIESIITGLETKICSLDGEIIVAKNYYDSVVDDFKNNTIYFRNRAIIEGIRNSIAHGNYEFISASKVMDTRIVFNNYYEGKCYFKLDISFNDFIEFLESSYLIILNEFANSKKMEKIRIKNS